MSEARKNLLTGEWVICASNRNGKPYDFIRNIESKTNEKKCPFCPGHEGATPKALYSDDSDENWNIRVFPNMYPVVAVNSNEKDYDSFYTTKNGIGLHEVVVDTRNHNEVIHDFSPSQLLKVIKVLFDRYNNMNKNEMVTYTQVFKNCGPEAGASINHSHWQILGSKFIGIQQRLEEYNKREYYEKEGCCLICNIVKHELKEGVRVILENEGFVAFVPYAPRSAYEIYIVPKSHITAFGVFKPRDIELFTDILGASIKKVSLLFKGVSYNICFHDTPKGSNLEYSHFYCRIVPRVGVLAGYEFSTGNYISHVLPEDSARYYRNIENEKSIR